MPSVRFLLPGLALGLAAPLLSAADAAPKSRDMDYVEVLGQRDNPYQVRSTTLGMKFAAETMRVPQSLQVFSAEGLRNQGVLDIGDVLKSVPSANAGQTRLARFASFSWTIRGFDAAVTRNGFRQLYFEDVDQSAFSHVARVEVLKGPGSSLFGQEGLGGTINLVTRRPQATPAIELQGAFGEDDLATGTFDVTGPLVEGGALSARTLAPDGWVVDACPVNGPSLSAQGETVAAVPAAFPAWWRRAGRCWWPGWPATARRGTCRRACRGPPTCPETAACDILSHPCGAGPLVG